MIDEKRLLDTSTISMRERLLGGRLFTDMCEGLPEERLRGKELCYDYNLTRPSEMARRETIARELFGRIGERFWIEPPIHFAYGNHIFVGNGFYANFNWVAVDDHEIHIGDSVLLGPNVVMSTTGHPADPDLRRTRAMYAAPITIGNDVWIGASAVICPGVTLGDGCVIGAGSVVTKDVPPRVIAAGVPCRVLREITAHDREYYWRDLRVDAP